MATWILYDDDKPKRKLSCYGDVVSKMVEIKGFPTILVYDTDNIENDYSLE